MNQMMRDTLALSAYAVLIFMLSAQSSLIATPMDFEHKDKLMHASAYAIMAFLAWRAFAHHLSRDMILALSSLLFASLYGISDEFHQSFVPGRDADIWDWLADTIGASLMLIYLYKSKKILIKIT